MPNDRKTKLSNGRALQPGATPLGTATRGASMNGPWYDNNGDQVDGPEGNPFLEKCAKKDQGDR